MKKRPLLERLIYGFEAFLEQANPIRVTEQKISNEAFPLFVHLIKMLKWEDYRNNDKHRRDINQKWLNRIFRAVDQSEIKPKPGRIKRWIFDEIKDSFEREVDLLKDNYGSLKEYRSDEEVLALLEKIYQLIDDKISPKKYKSFKIEDIFKELKIEIKGI